MHSAEMILYVANQRQSADFYATVLDAKPTLDVPGMTEFDLGGATLGLMPAVDMANMLPQISLGTGQRCELYLRRPDADALLARAVHAGGSLLSELSPRPWGETVGYVLAPDGHVLAVAQA